jgi:tetratricopeptide (TPR) repeat protein
LLLVGVALLVAGAVPGRTLAAASADDAKARATSKLYEAESLFNQDRLAESLQRLEEARALFPSPKIAFNFGKTYRALGRDADALAAFEEFLSKTDPADPALAERRPEAEQQARELREKGVVATPRAVPQVATAVVKPAPPVAPPPPMAPAPAPDARTIDLFARGAPPVATDTPRPFYRRWWVWTGAGAIVAGAVTAAVILSMPPGQSKVCSPNCGLGEFPVKP